MCPQREYIVFCMCLLMLTERVKSGLLRVGLRL